MSLTGLLNAPFRPEKLSVLESLFHISSFSVFSGLFPFFVDFVVWLLFFLILLQYSVGWHLPFVYLYQHKNLNVNADFGSLGLWVQIRCSKPTIVLGVVNLGKEVWSPVRLSQCTHGPKTAQEVNFKKEKFSSHVLSFLSGSFNYACEYNITPSHLWVDKQHWLKALFCS